jgi:hypothetical protein
MSTTWPITVELGPDEVADGQRYEEAGVGHLVGAAGVAGVHRFGPERLRPGQTRLLAERHSDLVRGRLS